MTIVPKKIKQTGVLVNDSLKNSLNLTFAVIIPIAVLAVGTFVWIKKETQIMKSRAKTLIFIGIFVACLALVSLVLVLTQPKTDKEDNPAANNSQTIPIVTHERDEVASMKITNASGEYTITQKCQGLYHHRA